MTEQEWRAVIEALRNKDDVPRAVAAARKLSCEGSLASVNYYIENQLDQLPTCR